MVAGDARARKELRELVPQVERAEVKSGDSRTAGFMLSHPASCALIREKARRGLERLAECKPYRVVGPVEVKVELTTKGNRGFRRREGVEQLNDRTWVFRGKDFIDAWLKFSSF